MNTGWIMRLHSIAWSFAEHRVQLPQHTQKTRSFRDVVRNSHAPFILMGALLICSAFGTEKTYAPLAMKLGAKA
jgi:hypothetical protein